MTTARIGAARFARAFRRHAAVLALPVALLCGRQFWWSLVVGVVAVGIEIVRFLRSPPFMRVRIEPEARDD
jgi:predicted cobalt transporter CbtA